MSYMILESVSPATLGYFLLREKSSLAPPSSSFFEARRIGPGWVRERERARGEKKVGLRWKEGRERKKF